MGTQRYSILYSSKTGNTKKLAEKIREVLPEENCDYFGTEGAKALSSDILYIGFWTDIGNAMFFEWSISFVYSHSFVCFV